MLMGRIAALTFALYKFPSICDYILWKGHASPPEINKLSKTLFTVKARSLCDVFAHKYIF
jgi:hypothetical protein